MNVLIEEAKRLRDRAKGRRKRGDRLRKAGSEEQAKKVFGDGLKLLEEAENKLKQLDAAQVAEDLAETLGATGGMLRRLGEERHDEALRAYQEGADVEEDHGLSSTYNRLNAIKFRLLTGRETLAALNPKIESLAEGIEDNLRKDAELSDRGWAWADLGDCQALLGDLQAAKVAYKTFINKAETQSPETTLKVLNDLAEAMTAANDPEAGRVRQAAATLQAELQSEEATT